MLVQSALSASVADCACIRFAADDENNNGNGNGNNNDNNETIDEAYEDLTILLAEADDDEDTGAEPDDAKRLATIGRAFARVCCPYTKFWTVLNAFRVDQAGTEIPPQVVDARGDELELYVDAYFLISFQST